MTTPAWLGRAGLVLILSAAIFGAGSDGPFASVPFGAGIALGFCAAHEALIVRSARRQRVMR